jgi:hypothetical protein
MAFALLVMVGAENFLLDQFRFFFNLVRGFGFTPLPDLVLLCDCFFSDLIKFTKH